MKKTYTKPSVEKREKLSHVAAGGDPVVSAVILTTTVPAPPATPGE